MEQPWLFQLRAQASGSGELSSTIAGGVVAPGTVAAAGADSGMPAFLIHDRITRRAPRVGGVEVVLEARAHFCHEFGGLPGKPVYLGRNCLEKARRARKGLRQQGLFVGIAQVAEVVVVLLVVYSLREGMLVVLVMVLVLALGLELNNGLGSVLVLALE